MGQAAHEGQPDRARARLPPRDGLGALLSRAPAPHRLQAGPDVASRRGRVEPYLHVPRRLRAAADGRRGRGPHRGPRGALPRLRQAREDGVRPALRPHPQPGARRGGRRTDAFVPAASHERGAHPARGAAARPVPHAAVRALARARRRRRDPPLGDEGGAHRPSPARGVRRRRGASSREGGRHLLRRGPQVARRGGGAPAHRGERAQAHSHGTRPDRARLQAFAAVRRMAGRLLRGAARRRLRSRCVTAGRRGLRGEAASCARGRRGG